MFTRCSAALLLLLLPQLLWADEPTLLKMKLGVDCLEPIRGECSSNRQMALAPFVVNIILRGAAPCSPPLLDIFQHDSLWPSGVQMDIVDCTPQSPDSGRRWNVWEALHPELGWSRWELSEQTARDSSKFCRLSADFPIYATLPASFGGRQIVWNAQVIFPREGFDTLRAQSNPFWVLLPQNKLDSAAMYDARVKKLRLQQHEGEEAATIDSMLSLGCLSLNVLFDMYMDGHNQKDLNGQYAALQALVNLNDERRRTGLWAPGENDCGYLAKDLEYLHCKRVKAGLEAPPNDYGTESLRVDVIDRIRREVLRRTPTQSLDTAKWEERCRKTADWARTASDRCELLQGMTSLVKSYPDYDQSVSPYVEVDTCRNRRWPVIWPCGSDFQEKELRQFDQSLNSLMDSDGLILDLREYMDDNLAPLLHMLGRFVDKPSGKVTIHRRIPGTDQSKHRTYVLQPRSKDTPFLKPLVIIKTRDWPQSAIYEWLAERSCTHFETVRGGSTGTILPDTVDVGLGIRVLIPTAVVDDRNGAPLRTFTDYGTDEYMGGDWYMRGAETELPKMIKEFQAGHCQATIEPRKEIEPSDKNDD